MLQRDFEPIYPNPYIAGNPVRSKEMFFGRVDEFNFIARALEDGRKTALIVLFGERRSGKSSILYQILNGKLGEAFLPFFVDMQIMAGVSSDVEFFSRLIADACKTLGQHGLAGDSYASRFKESAATDVFRMFLQQVKAQFPERAILLLLDEYEILAAKITEGSLPRHLLTFFAGLLETELVSFIFTGSKSLEAEDRSLWGVELLRKAAPRQISFLTKDDTARLITQPVQGKVTFAPEAVEAIYTLTAGQPFYTQMICQNLVYHLNEVEKYNVENDDLQAVVDGIIENPPPQLLFNWNEQSPGRKLALSLLAEFSEAPQTFLSARELWRGIAHKKLALDLDENFLSAELNTLFKDEYVLQKGRKYAFRLDLYRRWVRHDHSIWQTRKEIGTRELIKITKPAHAKKQRKEKRYRKLERVGAVMVFLFAVSTLLLWYLERHKQVVIRANGGPFRIVVDDDTLDNTATFQHTEKLLKGRRELKAVLLATHEVQSHTVDIVKDDQIVDFKFKEIPVAIITDAASFIAKLDDFSTRSDDNPESWKDTLFVAAGAYHLTVEDAHTHEVKNFGQITIRDNLPPINVDFDSVVVLTFDANLRSFFYEYSLHGEVLATDMSVDSFLVLRGQRKGPYQFKFYHPQAEEVEIDGRNIGKDTTILIEFKLKTKPLRAKPTPPRPINQKPSNTYALIIDSNPREASIIVDGASKGETPTFVTLSAGAHSLRLKKEGYDPIEETVKLRSDTSIIWSLQPQYGSLKLVVQDEKGQSLPNIEVFIDGEPYDKTTPISQPIELLAGKHLIQLKSVIYVSVDSTCIIEKNETFRLTISMRRKRR